MSTAHGYFYYFEGSGSEGDTTHILFSEDSYRSFDRGGDMPEFEFVLDGLDEPSHV